MQSPRDAPEPPVDQAQPRTIALYPVDVEAVERIRAHFGLDSFSQAVRRAIRIALDACKEKDVA